MSRANWADKGQQLRLGPTDPSQWLQCVGASRLGGVETLAPDLSLWLQVHGSSWVDAREGRFHLRPSDWIAFSREARPVIQADARGICVGVSIPESTLRTMAHFGEFGLHVGRGQVARDDALRIARLWYRVRRESSSAKTSASMTAPTRSLLLTLEQIQASHRQQMLRCPGPTLARKRQVFERMQRARLYLEGHCDRVVRISELAQRAQFSTWYFSRVFHQVYGESPQTTCSRLRLQRAAGLLASTSMGVAEIGSASGFENNCSFARSFRAHFGMTASQYRAASRPLSLDSQTCGTSRAHHLVDNSELLGYSAKNRIRISTHNVSKRLTRS